jgi:two-component system alkaline phosphatase synthesis response regulator PhoP
MFRRMDVRSGSQIALDSLLLDDDKRQVFADGVLCPLTYKEHELLKYLLLNQEIVLTREKMMDKVWGTDFAGESRTVDMHIKTLRQKLGSCGNMIKTVRNVGYKIEV